jgi:signal transduction histidine kinase
LSRLKSGEIPLSNQTDRILVEIKKWLEGNEELAFRDAALQGQIQFLQNQVAFARGNAQIGILLGLNHPSSSPTFRLGPFEAIADRDRGGERLFLIRRQATRPVVLGFQANLVSLRKALREHASRLTAPATLSVDLASADRIYAANDPLSLVRELNPLLPGWRVIVRPRDPGIISRYVTRQRWIYGSTLLLLVAGMVLGVVLVLRDLSRERRVSQLRTDFVAKVTHELKTPLTSIRMFAETLRMGRVKDAAGQQECMDVIVGETQRLSRLINTVLDFSKIERGEKRYRMDKISLSEVAESTLNILKYSLVEQGFALEAQIDPRTSILGDADALEQAMLNLIDNAIKYSRQTKSVHFSLWTEDNRVCFRVTDQGVGIPESEKGRIFEKFYRASTRNQVDTGGAGLGLTVVKNIVEAHGGAIIVESKVGEGSSFTVSLPRLPENPSNKGAEI